MRERVCIRSTRLVPEATFYWDKLRLLRASTNVTGRGTPSENQVAQTTLSNQ